MKLIKLVMIHDEGLYVMKYERGIASVALLIMVSYGGLCAHHDQRMKDYGASVMEDCVLI